MSETEKGIRKNLELKEKRGYTKSLSLLTHEVNGWFIDRGLDKAEPIAQFTKLVEEVAELGVAIVQNDTEETIDAIGDSLVVLIGICLQLDLDLATCLETAYDVIKLRTGKLVNGIWVKDHA